MKIVAWGRPNGASVVPAGEKRQFNIEVAADAEDIDVSYVVLLGYDDMHTFDPDSKLVARIISRLQEENEELRKAVVERDLLERLLVDRGWSDDLG